MMNLFIVSIRKINKATGVSVLWLIPHSSVCVEGSGRVRPGRRPEAVSSPHEVQKRHRGWSRVGFCWFRRGPVTAAVGVRVLSGPGDASEWNGGGGEGGERDHRGADTVTHPAGHTESFTAGDHRYDRVLIPQTGEEVTMMINYRDIKKLYPERHSDLSESQTNKTLVD